jgi:hypothetical protein
MKPEISVSLKTIGTQFYLKNIGFFLFLFVFFFGIVTVANYFFSFDFVLSVVSSAGSICFVLGLFFLYYLKCLNFSLKFLREPENEFLYSLSLYKNTAIISALSAVHFFIFAPAFAYTLWMFTVAIYTKHFLASFVIIAYNLILAGLYIFVLQNKIFVAHDPFSERKKIFFNIQFPGRGWSLPLLYFFNEQPIVLLGTKLFSVSMFAVWLHFSESYSIYFPLIGFTFALLGHIIFIQQQLIFEETQLQFSRNLPFARLARFFHSAILYFILLIPETLQFIRFTPLALHWYNGFEILFFGCGMLLLFRAIVFSRNVLPEQLFSRMFYAFIPVFFLLLLRVPVEAIILLLWICAWFVFRIFYTRYQYFASEEE